MVIFLKTNSCLLGLLPTKKKQTNKQRNKPGYKRNTILFVCGCGSVCVCVHVHVHSCACRAGFALGTKEKGSTGLFKSIKY